MSSFLYAIKTVGADFVKLGYANDVLARLRDLQCASPFPLSVLAVKATENQRKEERELHERHRLLRVRSNGEWFHYAGSVRAEIASWKRLSTSDESMRPDMRFEMERIGARIAAAQEMEAEISGLKKDLEVLRRAASEACDVLKVSARSMNRLRNVLDDGSAKDADGHSIQQEWLKDHLRIAASFSNASHILLRALRPDLYGYDERLAA